MAPISGWAVATSTRIILSPWFAGSPLPVSFAALALLFTFFRHLIRSDFFIVIGLAE